MSSRAKTISELPQINSVANDCLLIVEDVNTPTGNSNTTTSSITLGKLFNSNLDASFSNLVINNDTTPANSTANVSSGTFWYDSDYLYIATSNNIIKRVSLTSF